ncbi:GntR family transcriptional regulator [Streptomyces sp. NPDC002668]|uniref:GntR family transcriptional regulator n=1 Tax=Streptomyces sp. NPDC002668 TaxID=3154422 RepID=UPI00331C17DD
MPEPKSRKTPEYRRIANDLRAAIDRGEYQPGQRIPGENDLIRKYEVSRNTARDALAVLRHEGLTDTRRGAGNFVRQFKLIPRPANERLSRSNWGEGRSIWSADMQGRPSSEDVTIGEIKAPERIAGILGVPVGGRVLRRSRVHLSEGRPVQLSTSYFPASLVAGSPITQPDSGPGGVYARLLDLGHPPARFREEVRARMPLGEEAKALKLAAGVPVVHIVRTAFEEDGTPLEVNEMVLDGNSYLLQYDIDA